MQNIPISQVTVIAAVLGLFFLVVAFYKSLFHKRMPPAKNALPSAQAEAEKTVKEEQPVKLSNPFQQVPIDAIPQLTQKREGENAPFYPQAQQHPSSDYVSAFRQYNPNILFDETAHASKNTTTYEWE